MADPGRYPTALRSDVNDLLHGVAVADPYRWLEDATDPATVAWSAAQDELWADVRRRLPADEFARRIAALVPGELSAPARRGDRLFFTRREADQNHAVLLVREPDGAERVLVDPNARSADGTVTLDAVAVSPGGERVAYQVSEGGDEESVLYVLDVATGADIDGPIDRCRYSPVAWAPDGEAFFFVRYLSATEAPDDEPHLHRRVHRHVVGQAAATDELVAGGGSARGTYWGLHLSTDGRWLTVSAAIGTAPRNDVWVHDLETSAWHTVQEGVDARTSAHVHDGTLWLHTNRDAPRWRLCRSTPTGADGPWDTVIAEDAAVLSGVAHFDGGMVATWSRDVVDHLTVHDPDGRAVSDVGLPGLGSVGVTTPLDGRAEAWVAYVDFTDPGRVLRVDLADRAAPRAEVWGRPPGVDGAATDTAARQVGVISADGTRVPAFVLGPADDVPRPTILYGYGGFNISLAPAYSASIAAWVQAGGRYVVANLRGGSEYGEDWHRAGMREHKQNVFDDFAAVADWLVAEGLTTTDRLGISGGSNGGLLVGAALTQRPDAYAAVVCSAPLLDMVRYERFGLGETWNDEYGRAADPVEFGWLYAYSPYHRVVEGSRYPATLFTLFDSDTRVDPLHGRKLCAALQHATSADPADAPVVLRREADVGHGARGVDRDVALRADTLAFLAAHTGLTLVS